MDSGNAKSTATKRQAGVEFDWRAIDDSRLLGWKLDAPASSFPVNHVITKYVRTYVRSVITTTSGHNDCIDCIDIDPRLTLN